MMFIDKILAISKQDALTFSKISSPSKISIITPGIHWKDLCKVRRNSNGATLLYLGRLSKNKRLDRMINVLYHLKQKLPQVKLMIVGKDWGEKRKLTKLISKLNLTQNIKFTGAVPDAKEYYSKSDLFLLSSEYEGFGISVLEAMATGLPVIVSNIETMKELVENDKNGYLVNFDDYSAVADIIYKLLNDKNKYKKLSYHCKQFSRKFDWAQIFKKTEATYLSV